MLKLDGASYAVPIRALIAKEAGIHLSRATVYITLDRLERKGLLVSSFSEPTAEPGGKARRVFRLQSAGLTALRVARHAADQLAAGTVLARGKS